MTLQDYKKAEELLKKKQSIQDRLKVLKTDESVRFVRFQVQTDIKNHVNQIYQQDYSFTSLRDKPDEFGEVSAEGADRIKQTLLMAVQFIQQIYVNELAKVEQEFEKLGSI